MNRRYEWKMRAVWRLICIQILPVVMGASVAHAQTQQRDRIHEWPDSLEIITTTGRAMVYTDGAHPWYGLDEIGDGTPDYRLSFGPWWYEPSSAASRPENGQDITVTGALQEGDPLDVILVFEIDGLVWRLPTLYGGTGWNLEPFLPGGGVPLTVTGMVLVDTTYFYPHHFLDTTGDSIPEYQLGLGPPWYEPVSGAERPSDGDTVTITGLLHERDGIDLLAVYEIDGQLWRPHDEPPPWAGQWVRRHRPDSTRVFCVNGMDPDDFWIAFPPGFMAGPGWPDSMFVQFWEIHPDSLPGLHTRHRFSGFYVDVHDPAMTRMMNGEFGGHRGRMRFEKQLRVRMRYYPEDLVERGLLEEDLEIQYWDAEEEEWRVVPGMEIGIEPSAATFESYDLSNYYAFYAPKLSTGTGPTPDLPVRFELEQNYPNPFNPSTVIPFNVSETATVVLEVFDVLGRRVSTLMDGVLTPGRYQSEWDGTNAAGMTVAGGIYLYRLRAGDFEMARAMVFAK